RRTGFWGARSAKPGRRKRYGRPAMRCQPPCSPPAACPRTSTLPPPPTGLSISLSSRTSGEPYLSWTIAFTVCTPPVGSLRIAPRPEELSHRPSCREPAAGSPRKFFVRSGSFSVRGRRARGSVGRSGLRARLPRCRAASSLAFRLHTDEAARLRPGNPGPGWADEGAARIAAGRENVRSDQLREAQRAPGVEVQPVRVEPILPAARLVPVGHLDQRPPLARLLSDRLIDRPVAVADPAHRHPDDVMDSLGSDPL